MNELDFEYHVKRYEILKGPSASPESEAYFTHKAQDAHIFAVRGALLEAQLNTQSLEGALLSDRAKEFFRYGVGRRLSMIWRSYCAIIDLVAPDRKKPLRHDDVSVVESDLNLIYFNIVGALDGYAWCLLHEVTPDRVGKLSPVKVELFYPNFIADSKFDALKPLLDKHRNWYSELKQRRDPVAHRFPLYVPPCTLNPEQQARYLELERQIFDARKELDFDRHEELRRQQETVGTFAPIFVHDFEKALIPIYPTVPQDIANLLSTGKCIEKFLAERQRAA